jgi:hypothetical protein
MGYLRLIYWCIMGYLRSIYWCIHRNLDRLRGRYYRRDHGEADCAYYQPYKGVWLGACYGDGHYMCEKCEEWIGPEDAEITAEEEL